MTPGMGFLRHAAKVLENYAGKKADDLEASRVASANKGEKTTPALKRGIGCCAVYIRLNQRRWRVYC